MHMTHGGVSSDSIDFSELDNAFPFCDLVLDVSGKIGRRIAFRADAQLVTLAWVPVAVRLSAGISLPIGDPDPESSSRAR
jgi:hypothetical protein